MRVLLQTCAALGRAAIVSAALLGAASAQDMMRNLDLSSPAMTEAEMTREALAAMLEAAPEGQPLDLTGKRLNGLDLSGLDFRGATLRGAYLNKTSLASANLDKAVLDAAWALAIDGRRSRRRGPDGRPHHRGPEQRFVERRKVRRRQSRRRYDQPVDGADARRCAVRQR